MDGKLNQSKFMESARKLFDEIDKFEEEDVLNFISDLERFIACKIKRNYSDEYLIGSVFKENAVFKNNEFRQLSKAQVSLAYKSLIKIKTQYVEISTWPNHAKSFINELLFDLKTFIEAIVDDEDYEFIGGWKSGSDSTQKMFLESQALFYSSLSESGAVISHRGATNLAILGLRQALEVRFKRALGILRIFDNPMIEAKLRHDFLPGFVDDNRDIITLRIKSMDDLMKIYKWTNYTIHNGGLPKVWEVDFAYGYCSDLFRPEPMEGGSWSVHSSFIIEDQQEMRKRLELKVKEELPPGNWQIIYLERPESVARR